MTKLTAKKKVEMQEEGIKFCCHVELDIDAEPDGCVKDYGVDNDCDYAKRHKTREGCPYWRPINKNGETK